MVNKQQRSLSYRRNRPQERVSQCLLRAVERNIETVRKALSLQNSVFKLLVAVSGGIDSHVLLHIFWSLQKKLRLEPLVVHVDHGLRSESKNDAQFVGSLARKYSLPFLLFQASPLPEKENVEAWARRIRYEFFSQALESTQAHLLATAHQKNDQVETLLLRLLSGRLATVAGAIAPFLPEKRFFRPLLAISRDEIERYGKEYSLEFVFDTSNADLERTRNRVRHELLPLLMQYNPNILSTVSAVAMRVQDDENFLWDLARTQRAQMGSQKGEEYFLSLSPVFCWRELKLLAQEQLGSDALKLGYRACQMMIDFLRSAPHAKKKVHLGFGICGSLNAQREVTFEVSVPHR